MLLINFLISPGKSVNSEKYFKKLPDISFNALFSRFLSREDRRN